MKLTEFIQKIGESEAYKTFNSENPGAFMAAGFFVMDNELGKNVSQIDYFVPSTKKIVAFTLADQITMQILTALNEQVPEKISEKINIELEELEGIVHDEMRNRSMSEEIKKVVAVLQSVDGKAIWSISCVLSGMGILKSKVEDKSKSVLSMEKASIFDFVQKMSPAQLQTLKARDFGKAKDLSKEEVDKEIKELDKLGKDIEKEKEEIKKSLNSGVSSK